MKATAEKIEEAQIELRAMGYDISAHDPQEIKEFIKSSKTMKQAIRDITEYWDD